MNINFDYKGSIMTIMLSGEIDHHVAEKIRHEIDKRIDEKKIKFIIFDFSEVTFMDSSGIGVVLGRRKKLENKNGKAFVTNCNKYVKQILYMAGVFTIVEYIENGDKAIEYIKNSIA